MKTMLTYIIAGYFCNFQFLEHLEVMDRMEKNNSDTCHHDEVTGKKRKGKP